MERQKPLLRGTFHQAMFFIAVGACPPLIIKSSNASEYVATAIYSAAVMMMFGFSALYHKFDWNKFTKKRKENLIQQGAISGCRDLIKEFPKYYKNKNV